jgi:hypothetical protein
MEDAMTFPNQPRNQSVFQTIKRNLNHLVVLDYRLHMEVEGLEDCYLTMIMG